MQLNKNVTQEQSKQIKSGLSEQEDLFEVMKKYIDNIKN
jgi:hypothetical protein